MDRVLYRDYLVNRRFFIYCSLACTNDLPSPGISLTTPGDLIDVIVYGTGKTGHFTHCANVFHVSPTLCATCVKLIV